MKIVEFKDYDNQTTPLSAYNLNRLQQNLITTKYQMTFSSAVSGGSTITLPCYYQVGQDTLDVFLNSELLKKASTKDSEGHYYEVGNSDTKSNQIKITSDWSIASGDVLNLIVRGTTDSYDQNLSPDKATQLADEISANKEEITALQTENSRLKGITNALPKISGEDTSLTLTNTANAPLSDIILKGNTSQQKYSGKNLLPITAQSVEKNGVTFTINNNQLTINGTATNYMIFFLNNAIWSYSANNPILEAGTYNFSFNNEIKFSDGGIAITIYNENSEIIYEKNKIKNNFSFSISEKGSCTIRMEITKGQVFDNNDLQFQIEQGSTATDYEPYVGGTASPNPDYPQDIKVVTGDNKVTISNADNTEKQELPISLGSLELCKIGNYQDYFYKSGSKWYLHKEVDKDIVDENNTIAITNPNTSNWYYQITPKKITSTASQTNQICNYYPNREIFNRNTNQGILKISNGDQIRIRYGTEDTVANFKTWLASNNIILYSLLATATNTEITDTTLISQLNALYNAYTYNDTTNITQTNANLPFYINAEAFKKIS